MRVGQPPPRRVGPRPPVSRTLPRYGAVGQRPPSREGCRGSPPRAAVPRPSERPPGRCSPARRPRRRSPAGPLRDGLPHLRPHWASSPGMITYSPREQERRPGNGWVRPRRCSPGCCGPPRATIRPNVVPSRKRPGPAATRRRSEGDRRDDAQAAARGRYSRRSSSTMAAWPMCTEVAISGLGRDVAIQDAPDGSRRDATFQSVPAEAQNAASSPPAIGPFTTRGRDRPPGSSAFIVMDSSTGDAEGGARRGGRLQPRGPGYLPEVRGVGVHHRNGIITGTSIPAMSC